MFGLHIFVDSLTTTTYPVSRSYTCNTGYTPNTGSGTISCQAPGTWSSPGLTCTISDCGVPTVSEPNGVVNSGCTTYDCSRTFSCASGYDIGGSVFTVTCQASGAWTGSSYSCSPVDCGPPPSLSGGSVDSLTTTTYPVSRSYTCNTGYTPNTGSGTISCQASGTWSSPGLTCTPIDCGAPTVSEPNGVVSSGCTTYDCSRTFTCASGYDIGGSVFTVTCQVSGAWTGSSYSCTLAVVACPAHPIKAYAKISGSGTTEGSTITYTCDDGAVLVSGNDPATSTCSAQGVWSTANIDCTKCSSYASTYTMRTDRFFNPPVSFTPSISGGSVTAAYCANACDTRSDFVCVAYYYRKSTGSYCVLRPMRVHDDTNHQQYDNADTAYDEYIRDCVVPCPDPPYLAYTSVSGTGSTRTYTCDTGAILSSGNDPATSTCTNGAWSSPNIQCTKCSSYASTYTMRTDRFFNPPVSFTPSISGGSVTAAYCANACDTRSDFVCVAYYYRKSTGSYCVLRPMRVHDDTNHQQYDNADTAYDEYIRDCA
ncbi:sushi, von Willebrand factor type A, EGF and pentraxin domain-containing protein 1-like [Mizuhopecten yessoensis]|uniref:sushi, von Willebrand factor type A, EGF and pentraxin domain-containing protein 1-like n=1 Tax=Mizuhopecten yessoensis TaxID=6573 RepID=UPI000B45870C|nr:sushi, von Willebrand factor type A, EGF and pentraxin domain-containing protein 1-like [Mizuhopecten yessoensis]